MFQRIAREGAEEARANQMGGNPPVPQRPGAASPPGQRPQGGGFYGQYFNNQPGGGQQGGFGSPAQSQGGFGRPGNTQEKLAAVPSNKKEKFETEIIQNLLSSYFDIVRKNVGDSVPKSIMFFLVNTSKETVQNELVKCLYKEDLFDELLEENPLIASKRKACKEMLDVLKKANDVLMEVREFNPAS